MSEETNLDVKSAVLKSEYESGERCATKTMKKGTLWQDAFLRWMVRNPCQLLISYQMGLIWVENGNLHLWRNLPVIR